MKKGKSIPTTHSGKLYSIFFEAYPPGETHLHTYVFADDVMAAIEKVQAVLPGRKINSVYNFGRYDSGPESKRPERLIL